MNIAEFAIAGLIILGSAFVLLGSIGLVKFPDFFMRLHAPTKASTLGVTALLLASALFFSLKTGHASLHEALIIVFLWVTAPISALMLASAARCRQTKDEATSKTGEPQTDRPGTTTHE